MAKQGKIGGFTGVLRIADIVLFSVAEMRKLNIISADCGYLLHFCRMRIFLQNYY